MGSRSVARELALQMLFFSDVSFYSVAKNLKLFYKIFLIEKEAEFYFKKLVSGVISNKRKIDNIIDIYSKNWKLVRMFYVDRNILRLSTFEILYCNDVPPKVAINEAIIIGKKYGGKKSGSFINAVLNGVYISLSKY